MFLFYGLPIILVVISIIYILRNEEKSLFDILVRRYNVEKYYKGRDSSHGMEHIRRVFFYLERIIEDIEDENDKNIVRIAALFHDAYDHKYAPKENLQEWIDYKKRQINKSIDKYTTNKEQKLIHRIIDNVSFTKEKKKRGLNQVITIRLMNCHNNQKKNNKEEYLRNIVSDADKLDAIGEEAIDRMYHYQEAYITHTKYSDEWFKCHIEHMQTHCKEKLYILMEHNYIQTYKGREIGKEHLQELKDIVDDDVKLVDYIREIK
jgi:HD superfamily phosphodiesterase